MRRYILIFLIILSGMTLISCEQIFNIDRANLFDTGIVSELNDRSATIVGLIISLEVQEPKQCAQCFADELAKHDASVTLSDSLDTYTDKAVMSQLDLIVPIWTMGKISEKQFEGLDQTVQSGVGLAGFHGGMIDAFRDNTQYQWMTGGQWVSHPGGCIASYRVEIADSDHPITQGIESFEMQDTEQYYCHTDPANHVLATTTFSGEHENPGLYAAGTVMPYAWTRPWGKGKVFCACWGHTHKDFEVSEAKTIVTRGMLWAAGQL